MRRWLVTGADGQLGGHVVAALRHRLGPDDMMRQIGSPSSGSADLRFPDQVRALLDGVRPTHILHLAAIASPLRAERERQSAHALHVIAAELFGAYAESTGALAMTASTDFVWSGARRRPYQEKDRPAPRTHYGRTKLAGEEALLRRGGLVLRYSLLFGPSISSRSTNWSGVMCKLANNEPIEGRTDEWRSPLALADAADITLALAAANQTGVIHVAGPEALTPFDLITRAKIATRSKARIVPTMRSGDPEDQARPRYVVQCDQRMRRLLPTFSPRSMEEALGHSRCGRAEATWSIAC